METHGASIDRARSVPADLDGMPMRRPLLPAIRWGAVMAGVAVGVSVQLALTLLGIATGVSTTDVTEGETFSVVPLLWAGFGMLAAAFVAGYVAARMSGLKRKSDGVLHGAVSWAVTTILFTMLAATVGGALVSGVFSNVSQLVRAGAPQTASPLSNLFRAHGSKLDADTQRRLTQALREGRRDEAVELIGTAMGVEPARAALIADEAMIVTGAGQNTVAPARAAARNPERAAGTTAWIVFFAVALALALGIGGGALGVAGSRRVSWAGGGPR